MDMILLGVLGVARVITSAHPEVARAQAPGIGWARRLAIMLTAVTGVAAIAVGAIEIVSATQVAMSQYRLVGTNAEMQRFVFERGAWQGMAADSVFAPTLSASGGPSFTRIEQAQRATCASALSPALVRQLGASRCIAVLRADYTDPTQTMVATVGFAALDVTPALEQALSGSTQASDMNLAAHPLTIPGTAAVRFGDAQRVWYQTSPLPDQPYLTFAVAGFADGRPASAIAGTPVVAESGLQAAADSLDLALASSLESQAQALWARRSQ